MTEKTISRVTRRLRFGLWCGRIFGVKPFKIYFDHEDTPYRKECQSRGRYDVEWKRLPYHHFLGHKVVKMKLFGVVEVFDLEKKMYWDGAEEKEDEGK